ncbi:MAG: diguanylate cyclase, partial [Chitinispirillales bacterium]|nr:diguanylate cyclase [Chitinispirillales bacterium]
MSKINNGKVLSAVFLFAGILIMFIDSGAAKALGGMFAGAGFAALFPRVFSFGHSGAKGAKRYPEPREAPNPLQSKAEAAVEKETAALQGQRLGSEYRKKQRQMTEVAVDEMLDMFISLIAGKLPYCTIAVFFPARDGSYALRRNVSKTRLVNQEAMIIPRRGILGSLLTKELQPFYEPGFTNKNATLYYYNEPRSFEPEESIRSILLSPIEAVGETRGILLVDNTKANAYCEDDLAFLTTAAKLLGQAVYYAYLNTEHSLDYQRLAATSSIEKDFWKDLDFDTVMDKVCETIRDAVPCDRLTVSLKEEDKMHAATVRAIGDNSGWFKDIDFPLGDNNPKSLVSLAYSTDIGFYRNFHEERYEYRYSEDEPQDREFGSFMAVPIGIDKRIGMMFIESRTKDAFTDFNFGLLSRLGTSAGLALEKIFLIRKADAMATHDGLTGLFNRSHFQKILTTKIAGSKRYGHPVSLVLGDIDFFKKLNDNYGHPFGDAVLKGVAQKLESCVRIDVDT